MSKHGYPRQIWLQGLRRAVPVLLLPLLVAGCQAGASKTDAERISDVHAVAALAERFKEATGFYPLADLNHDVPISVHLSERRIPERYSYPPDGKPGVVWGAGTFAEYLADRLGSPVEQLPTDNRRIKDLPYFYVYSFDGNDYFIAAVLEQATEETRNVADRYETYEVGSKAVPERRIRRFDVDCPVAFCDDGSPDAPVVTPYRAEAAFIPRRVDRLAVLELFERHELDRLESMLDDLDEEARLDPRREQGLEFVLKTLGSGEPSLEPRVEDWVAQRPDSRWAHVVRARHFYVAGYRARGGRWAKDTEESQFDEMRRLHSLAVASARRALKLDDRLLDPYVVMIDIAKTASGQRACQAMAREAIAIEPASFRVWHIAVSCQVPKWGGSLQEMHRLAHEAQQHAERNPRLQVLLGYVDMERGDAHRSAERLPAALEAYDRALAFGEHHHFYENRAWAYSKLGRHEEALADRTRALELSPQDVDLLADRLLSLASLGRFPEMRADLELAARIEPTDPTLLSRRESKLYRRAGRLAYDLYAEGRLDAARELLTEILDNDPDYAYGNHCLGLTYKDSDPERALGLFERAIEIHPEYYNPHEYVHWLRGRKGEWRRVLEMWIRFLEIEPGESRAYFQRAKAQRRLGRPEAAAADLREACGLGYEEACEKPAPASARSPAAAGELSRYGAQPTPQLAWERFLEIQERRITSPDLGIYDAAARAILLERPSTTSGQEHIAKLYKNARPEIRARHDLAAVVFPDDTDHRLAPWFFHRGSEGWQFDGSMYPDVIGYNHVNQWRFKRTDHHYAWAFADYTFDDHGFATRRAR